MLKRKLLKQALPMILSVAMVFQSTPVTSYAAESTELETVVEETAESVVETPTAGEEITANADASLDALIGMREYELRDIDGYDTGKEKIVTTFDDEVENPFSEALSVIKDKVVYIELAEDLDHMESSLEKILSTHGRKRVRMATILTWQQQRFLSIQEIKEEINEVAHVVTYDAEEDAYVTPAVRDRYKDAMKPLAITVRESTGTEALTVKTKAMDAIKSLKASDIMDIECNITFTHSTNDCKYRIEIRNGRNALVRTELVDTFNGSLKMDEDKTNTDKNVYAYIYHVDDLVRKSDYKISVTPVCGTETAKTATIKVKTTDIPAYRGNLLDKDDLDAGTYTATFNALKAGYTDIEVSSKLRKGVIARWRVKVKAVGEAGDSELGDFEETDFDPYYEGTIEVLTEDNPVDVNTKSSFDYTWVKFQAPSYGYYTFEWSGDDSKTYFEEPYLEAPVEKTFANPVKLNEGDTIYMKGYADFRIAVKGQKYQKLTTATSVNSSESKYVVFTAPEADCYTFEATGVDMSASYNVNGADKGKYYFDNQDNIYDRTVGIALEKGDVVAFTLNDADKNYDVSVRGRTISKTELSTTAVSTGELKKGDEIWYQYTATAAGNYTFKSTEATGVVKAEYYNSIMDVRSAGTLEQAEDDTMYTFKITGDQEKNTKVTATFYTNNITSIDKTKYGNVIEHSDDSKQKEDIVYIKLTTDNATDDSATVNVLVTKRTAKGM